MKEFHVLEVKAQGLDERIGEDGEAVILPFSVANDDLMVVEVYILYPQAHGLHTCTCAALRRKCRCQAQSRTIEELSHEFMNSRKVIEDLQGFLPR